MRKRVFDLTISCLLFVISIPFFLILPLFIFLFLGRPILFKQNRTGLHGESFVIYKFRTMSIPSNTKKHGNTDQLRLSSFGKALRASSLDELPSLWNVLKGEMSLVGPRPLLVEYLKLYNKKQKRRLELKPGMTGWAQINGRNNISWEEKFKLDLWYIDNHSVWLDLKILIVTFSKVLLLKDISENGQATMSKFKGNKK